MKKMLTVLCSLSYIISQNALPILAESNTVHITKIYLGEYGVCINGKSESDMYYNEGTGEWYNCFGELITETTLPIQKATYHGVLYTVDIEKMQVYTEDGTLNTELSTVLPEYLSPSNNPHPWLIRSINGSIGSPLDPEFRDVLEKYSIPIVYRFNENEENFSCDIAVAGTYGPIYSLDYAPDAHEYPQIRTKTQEYSNNGEIITDYLKPSDINIDGMITVADAIMLARILAEDSAISVSDLGRLFLDTDANGKTDTDDLTALLQQLAGIKK